MGGRHETWQRHHELGKIDLLGAMEEQCFRRVRNSCLVGRIRRRQIP